MTPIHEEIDLQEIRRLMAESQQVVYDRGVHFIAWGIVIAAALTLSHLAVQGVVAVEVRWIWVAAITTGWLISLIVGRRESRAAPVETTATRLLTTVWIGCGITLTVLGMAGGMTGSLTGSALDAVVAAVLGLCYLATGAVYRQGWVRLLAIAWWIGAVAMFSITSLPSDLMLASLIVLLQIVPGVMLYQKARSRVSPASA